MAAVIASFSNSLNTLKTELTSRCENARICLSGKYHSFVDWTAQNSVDFKEKLAVQDSDCCVKKTAKVALTILASLILFIPAAIKAAFASAKNFVCTKGSCSSANTALNVDQNSNSNATVKSDE